MVSLITPLPPAPQRTDPANFPARADALVAALPNLVSQINAVALATTGSGNFTNINVTGAATFGRIDGGAGWNYSASINTTSGSTFDFLGIPSWSTEVTLLFTGCGLSGVDDLTVQVGHAGGLMFTGYSAAATLLAGGSLNCIGSSTGFQIRLGAAADSCYGVMNLTKVNGNFWNSTHNTFLNFGRASCGGGGVFIAGPLDRVRLTQTGSSTFDFGSVRIGWR